MIIKKDTSLEKNTKKEPFEKREVMTEEGSAAYFANYFGIELSADDCTISFGQKVPISKKPNQIIFEIRRRIVMTRRGLLLLRNLLNKAIDTSEKKVDDNKK
jgi:hypothetical protein